MPLTRIKSLGITDGTILGADINSTFDLTGKTVTLPAGTGGKVLQVVTATDSTQRTATSSSFVTASNTLSVTITPSSASNKVLILANTTGHNSSQDVVFYWTIYRGSTNLGTSNGMTNIYWSNGASIQTPVSMTYLDSPNTTSATTYQVYMKSSSGTMYVNVGSGTSSITALEIAG